MVEERREVQEEEREILTATADRWEDVVEFLNE